jgi:hypothetical protein
MPPPRTLSRQDLAAADLAHIAKPVIVLDAVCRLSTGFAKFAIRHDRDGRFLFLAAQSSRGDGLYRRLGRTRARLLPAPRPLLVGERTGARAELKAV